MDRKLFEKVFCHPDYQNMGILILSFKLDISIQDPQKTVLFLMKMRINRFYDYIIK